MNAIRRTAVSLTLAAAAVVALTACDAIGGSSGATGGTLVIATPADAQSLLPLFAGHSTGQQVADLLFDRLANIGDSLNTLGDHGFRPELASSWTWAPDSLSIAFHLEPRARWHDGAPVRAEDARFTFALTTNAKVQSDAASLLTQIDSVSVRDSLTPVFWFKRRYPEQFFDAVYHLHVLPAHLLASIPVADLRTAAFNRNPVGTGRFRFIRWDQQSRIELIADTANWRGRAKLDRVIVAITPDANSMFTRVFSGEADVAEPVLNPAILNDVQKHPGVVLVGTAGSDYAFVQFNLHDPHDVTKPHPIFGEVRTRRAIAMGVDRASLVRSVFDSLALPSTGPMTRWQQLADTTVPLTGYDPVHARALLDSLGWRDDGTGIRAKDGKPLRFPLLIPGTSRGRQQIAVLLQDALKKIGVQVDIEQADFGAMMDRLTRGNFDATISAIHTDPSASAISQTWGHSGDRRLGGQNFGIYENRMFDQAVDSALRQMDPVKARAYFRRAYQTIAEDVPAIFLYEPRWTGVVNKRIRTTEIRPDAWWAGMADWSIAPRDRIARDKVGLSAPSK